MMNENTLSNVINDPVHQILTFNDVEKSALTPILGSPEFQRLRHIRQLGFVEYVFPTAVNTRFSHCLGACYLAKRIAKQLQLHQDQKILAMLCALIHDIGHGPFSHMFERVLLGEKKVKHDYDWLACFIDDFVAQGLLSQSMANDCRAVFSLINKPQTSHIIADIVSSQLDADRLDYLLRDSYFCGVSYGKVNFEWLLSCMKAVDVNGIKRLGVMKKSVPVLEHFIMARRLMMKNIYGHGKVNAVRFYMQHFLNQLADVIDGQQYAFLRHSVLGQYLFHLQQYKRDYIQRSDFIANSFPLYRQLVDYDVWAALRELSNLRLNDDCVTLAKRIFHRKIPHAISVTEAQVGEHKDAIQAFFVEHPKLKPWQLHLDTIDFTSYDRESNPIYIDDPHSHTVNVKDVSGLFSFLTEQPESIRWLYIDKDLYAAFQQTTALV